VNRFEWDEEKNQANIEKHGIDFRIAQKAFLDSRRVILADEEHSQEELRFYCLGWRRNCHGKIYDTRWSFQNFWRRVLAQWQEDL
jgi:uncharacterized DUF497 family protein